MSDRVILHLKDGDERTCLLPWNAEMRQNLIDCGQDPARVAGKTLRLSTPERGIFEIKAADIASLELPAPHCLIRDLLSPQEAERAMAHVLAHEHEFLDSTVSDEGNQNASSADTRFRRSRILNDIQDMAPLVASKLHVLLPEIWPQLRLPQLPLTKLECQITAHGDGDFFNTHTDNGMPDIAHRQVSYVYYFHQEPKRFTGGHLRFYNTWLAGGLNTAGALAADIEPPRNSLMVFASHLHHEVTPIRCESTALADQRLTINGWLCL